MMNDYVSFPRRIRRRFYYVFVKALLGVAQCLPTSLGRGACRQMARLALRLRAVERRRARANMAVALRDMDAAQRNDLLKSSTDRLGENLFDTLTVERQAALGFADVVDDGVLETVAALRAEGRGVIILTGHFGCWELLGAWLARGLGGLAVVTGTVHNAPVARLLGERRSRLGLTPLPRQGDLRPLLRTLAAGGVIAVLMDQNTHVENIDVPFCGRPAPTSVGFGRLAMRYGVPVVPVAIGRDGLGHRVRHLPPLHPPVAAERGGGDEQLREFLRNCNAALETMLTGNPAEWVWFHNRWPDV